MQIYTFGRMQEAKEVMSEIGVTPRGIQIMAEKAVFLPVRLENLDTRAANILKQTMLSQGAEAAVSAETVNLSASHTDVLVLATAAQLKKAVPRLKEQPWGLRNTAQELEKLLEKVLEGDC